MIVRDAKLLLKKETCVFRITYKAARKDSQFRKSLKQTCIKINISFSLHGKYSVIFQLMVI